MRKLGLLIASLMFMSLASFADENGQVPTKDTADKIGEKDTGEGLVATGDKGTKKNEKKKPTNPPPPPSNK